MADIISKEKRSWNMSRIKGKNTKPEILVRKMLHKMGYRFRLHRKDLPGCPDIVIPKHKTAIFVNGCFWHRHPDCRFAYTPKTRIDFWTKKFTENIKRDSRNQTELISQGWKVVVIWECETDNPDKLLNLLSGLFK